MLIDFPLGNNFNYDGGVWRYLLPSAKLPKTQLSNRECIDQQEGIQVQTERKHSKNKANLYLPSAKLPTSQLSNCESIDSEEETQLQTERKLGENNTKLQVQLYLPTANLPQLN